MKNLATVPDYYPIIVDLNCVPSMLGMIIIFKEVGDIGLLITLVLKVLQ